MTRHAVLLFVEINQPVKESIYSFLQILDVWLSFTTNPDSGAGIAQLVVLGLAAKVSRVRYSSGDIFR